MRSVFVCLFPNTQCQQERSYQIHWPLVSVFTGKLWHQLSISQHNTSYREPTFPVLNQTLLPMGSNQICYDRQILRASTLCEGKMIAVKEREHYRYSHHEMIYVLIFYIWSLLVRLKKYLRMFCWVLIFIKRCQICRTDFPLLNTVCT